MTRRQGPAVPDLIAERTTPAQSNLPPYSDRIVTNIVLKMKDGSERSITIKGEPEVILEWMANPNSPAMLTEEGLLERVSVESVVVVSKNVG